jgi:hypothetical protein
MKKLPQITLTHKKCFFLLVHYLKLQKLLDYTQPNKIYGY